MVTETLPKINAELESQIITWLEENPYRFYGDRNDKLPDDMVQMLLDGDFVKFDEEFYEIEMNYFVDVDLRHIKEELWSAFPEIDSECQETCEQLFEIIRMHFTADCSDVLKTMFRHTSPKVAAYLYYKNGDALTMPLYGSDDLTTSRYLRRFLGIDCELYSPSWNESHLAAIGTVDLKAIYEDQKVPTHITLQGKEFLIAHDQMNGAGDDVSCHVPRPATFPCKLVLDSGSRYGIQSVFGFTSSAWSNELELKFEEDSF